MTTPVVFAVAEPCPDVFDDAALRVQLDRMCQDLADLLLQHGHPLPERINSSVHRDPRDPFDCEPVTLLLEAVVRPRRRPVPSQCLGCGQFVGPASSAWATGYHPECEPGRR